MMYANKQRTSSKEDEISEMMVMMIIDDVK
jgi:hypothetical protein